MLKVCTKCKDSLPLLAFGKRNDKPDGLSTWCKLCRNKGSRTSRIKMLQNDATKRNRDRAACKRYYNTKAGRKGARQRYLKRAYRLSVADYNKLFNEQEGKCAICGKKQSLCIDHCHIKGGIRGLLCDNCNKGLGNFRDDREYLQSAIEYLKVFDSEKAKNKREKSDTVLLRPSQQKNVS